MPTSLSAQLAAIDAGQLSIAQRPASDMTDVPASEDMAHTVTAVWSDLFTLMQDSALEAEIEGLAWGVVNLFHRQAMMKERAVDRATDEIRMLVASADGSEVHTAKLEEQIDRAQLAAACQDAFEEMRETAAGLYLAETNRSWTPASGSRVARNAKLTSAVVAGRDYMKSRAEQRRTATTPEGTPVIFAGGRLSFETEADARTFAENIWSTLDKVHAVVPRHGARTWRRRQGRGPARGQLGRTPRHPADRVRAPAPAREPRRVQAQRGVPSHEAALRRGVSGNGRSRAPRHRCQEGPRAGRRPPWPARHEPQARSV